MATGHSYDLWENTFFLHNILHSNTLWRKYSAFYSSTPAAHIIAAIIQMNRGSMSICTSKKTWFILHNYNCTIENAWKIKLLQSPYNMSQSLIVALVLFIQIHFGNKQQQCASFLHKLTFTVLTNSFYHINTCKSSNTELLQGLFNTTCSLSCVVGNTCRVEDASVFVNRCMCKICAGAHNYLL